MTISFRAANGIGSGTTTTLGLVLPTGAVAGDMLIAFYGGKPYTVDVTSGTFLTDYTLAGNITDGTAANAVDGGSVRAHARYREMQSGDVAPTGTLSAAPSPRMNGMLAYQKTVGGAWNVATSTGFDSAATGTTRSITSGTLDLAVGDVVIVVVVSPSDSTTGTSRSLTGTGLTFSAPTNRNTTSGTTSGNDGSIVALESTVTAGSGTVALTYADTVTTGISNASAVFIRLREPAAITEYWGMRI